MIKILLQGVTASILTKALATMDWLNMTQYGAMQVYFFRKIRILTAHEG